MNNFDSPLQLALVVLAVLLLAVLGRFLLQHRQRRDMKKQDLRFRKACEKENRIWEAHVALHGAAAQQADDNSDRQVWPDLPHQARGLQKGPSCPASRQK